MNKFFLTDIDEVVLDWISEFKLFFESETGKTLIGFPKTPNMVEWIGLEKHEIRKIIDKFDQTSEIFGRLKATRQSEIYLPKIKELGYNIIAITASSTVIDSIQRRKNNIIKEIGDIFTNVHCVSCSTDKSIYLQLYPSSYFVEDKVLNAKMAQKIGHKGIIMRQSSNIIQEKDNTDLIWVDNWGVIYNLLTKD